TCFVGLRLQQRPDQRVELRVYQNHVFALRDSVQRDSGAKIPGSGHFDDNVDRRALEQHSVIVGEYRRATIDGPRGILWSVSRLPFEHAGFGERPLSMTRRAIGDANQAHAGNRCAELERNGAPGSTGTYDADTDRPAFTLQAR